MASTIRNAALKAVNKGQPASFYAADKTNPVLLALDQDIKLYYTYMKKQSAPDYEQPEGEASSRRY